MNNTTIGIMKNPISKERRYQRYDSARAVVSGKSILGLHLIMDNDEPAICYSHHTRLFPGTAVFVTVLKDDSEIPVVAIDSVSDYDVA